MKLIRKFGTLILSLNKSLWKKTSNDFHHTRLGLTWGRMIFALVLLRGGRNQLTTTYFFRNRTELRMLTEIVESLAKNQEVKITIIGCSSGAEVYSIINTLQKNIPSLRFEMRAYDIDEPTLEKAKIGIYPAGSRELSKCSQEEITEIFNKDGESFKVKDQYTKIVHWELNDPTREPVISSIPKQDLVIANRLLFHMSKNEQRRAMRAISSMVRSGGYISVVGADLDVRTQIAEELEWKPLINYIEDVHAGDETMTCDWPFKYWGLEPIDKKYKKWELRYCSFFQVP